MRYLVRMYNYIPNFLKPKQNQSHLGRWSNDCNIKTNKKIDFSNEDHCGPCGSLVKDKIIKDNHKH